VEELTIDSTKSSWRSCLCTAISNSVKRL